MHETTAAPMSVQSDLFAKFFHGLSNATRLRIVELLLAGDKSVGQLVDQLGVAQAQVSNHLACLKWCGYVTSTHQGRNVVYRISDPRVQSIVQLAKEVVRDNAAHINACTRMER